MTISEKIINILSETIDDITYIHVEDVTHKHLKHKSHENGKLHIKLTLSSNELSNMSKVSAHRAIYQKLAPLMSEYIHSLIINLQSASSTK